jgi:sterol desaturase/sphingolipid hydroxylase (fatty acid hydroxylase superfamily)
MLTSDRELWLTYFFKLTRREYFADFFITPPITLALAIFSVTASFSWLWPVTFVGGLLFWTLWEYATHRWISHRWWILREAHWLHHKRQKDYIAIHPAVTLGLYAVFWLLFGIQSSAFMIGFSCGYIAYATLHTMFHYAAIRGDSWLWTLKRHHALHHRFHDVNFGVVTTFWDRVLRTHVV